MNPRSKPRTNMRGAGREVNHGVDAAAAGAGVKLMLSLRCGTLFKPAYDYRSITKQTLALARQGWLA